MGPFIIKSSEALVMMVPTLLLMVSPLLLQVRVSAGHGALLPHIPGVTGDGQLVNLGLKRENNFV